jgi:imidazoleglycerol-phosphate dehydratase
MRKTKISRKTKETDIKLEFNLDGTGKTSINTGIPFFNHMLELFSVHGFFDLNLAVKGDIEVDYHHTVEDVGICLGKAFREAISDGKGITRFACGIIPMDEALCQIALDISGRPFIEFLYNFEQSAASPFNLEVTAEFFKAFADNALITIHIDMLKGKNMHHIIEACYKAFGIILDRATKIDQRRKIVPSTKGLL